MLSAIDLCAHSFLSFCPQHFRPEAPPAEGPQYMNKAFSAYRGIYIEKEDLQMELNKLVHYTIQCSIESRRDDVFL